MCPGEIEEAECDAGYVGQIIYMCVIQDGVPRLQEVDECILYWLDDIKDMVNHTRYFLIISSVVQYQSNSQIFRIQLTFSFLKTSFLRKNMYYFSLKMHLF